MNQVITDGLNLMPPGFSDGLGVWSQEDGTPGTDTYASATNAALVTADQDFGTCLEILKTTGTTRLRYMGETPVLPGLYLRVSARIKALSGTLPDVRIAGWAGQANNSNVAGVTQIGLQTSLTSYGQVVTVSAIIGVGDRGGVDMPWGETAAYGHFGLDLTGGNGGTVRIESIQVEDITHVFYRKLMDWVDVKDFGAAGDGTTDDTAAFNAADAAANGREVLVSEGTYRIATNLTMQSPVRFQGQLSMPDGARLVLASNFDLPSYADAFGGDEVQGFKKGFQAMLNHGDHDVFDLGGRRVLLDAPIDMQAAVGNKNAYSNQRSIQNGQFSCIDSPNWDDTVVTRIGTWTASAADRLDNVTNAGAIPIGSLVTANQGVGREIYVRAINIAAGRVFLSSPLGVPPSNQSYTFTRFKYILDFSGFEQLQRFSISNVEFVCAGRASAIMLPTDGLIFHVRDCFFTGPKDRGITSIDGGCAGMLLDRNQFLSNEQTLRVQDRTSIAFNTNSNDVKIRNNRSVKFKHFGVFGGNGNLITGNHWFQGDSEPNGLITAGIVLTNTNVKTTIHGNYIDNSFIEWGNEHDAAPEMSGEFSFGGLTINANIFTANGIANWSNFIQIKPYGPDHYINGLSICDNVFKHLNGGALDAAEGVDDSIAPIDASRTRNFLMTGNVYHGVSKNAQNPVTVKVTEASDTATWEIDLRNYLPFDSEARVAVSVQPEGAIRSPSNVAVYTMPYCTTRHGVGRGSIRINWSQPVHGAVQLTARTDTV
jgi:Pectate lyase superfamily protein